MTCEAHFGLAVQIVNINGPLIRAQWVKLAFAAQAFDPAQVFILDRRYALWSLQLSKSLTLAPRKRRSMFDSAFFIRLGLLKEFWMPFQ